MNCPKKLLSSGIFYAFLLACTYFQLDAQGKVYVHFDRPIYLRGENVYFKIYAPSLRQYGHSLVQLTMADNKFDSILYQGYIEFEHDVGVGSLSLPFDVGTTTFSFQGHIFNTDEQNFTKLFCVPIQVLGDEEEKAKVAIDTLLKRSGDLGMDIQFNAQEYQPGDSLTLQILMLDKLVEKHTNDLSVSVSFQPFVSEIIPSTVRVAEHGAIPSPSGRLAWRFHAKRQGDGQILKNKEITIFSQDHGIILHTQTDQQGAFSWSLPPFHQKIQVEVIDGQNHPCVLMPIIGEFICTLPNSPPNLNLYDVSAYLQSSKVRQRINYLLRGITTYEVSGQSELPWVPQPDYTVKVEDFEDVKNLSELCKLILTPLRYQNRRDTLMWRMINPIDKPFFDRPPLFIIDRSLTASDSLASTIDMQRVKRLDFYNTPKSLKYFGDKGKNGVVSMTTHFPSLYRREVGHLNGLVSGRNLTVINSKSVRHNMPDIDPLIYWNPSVRINGDHSFSTRLKLNDNIGTVIVQVFASNSAGEVAEFSRRFEVRP